MSDRDFRLSKDVMPTRYDLRIEVDLDRWCFAATEHIDITVHRPTADIVVHAIDLDIRSVQAVAAGATRPATISFNAEAETACLRFPEPLPVGPARLDIAFNGKILERLRGFYRSQKDGARYAATQFEAADARRAFPCFDEPEFKARFALTLVVPAGVTAVANGSQQEVSTLADGRRAIRFAETPPISSYLVAFCVGPFESTPVVRTPSGVPVRVVLPQGLAEGCARTSSTASSACPAPSRRADRASAQGATRYPRGCSARSAARAPLRRKLTLNAPRGGGSTPRVTPPPFHRPSHRPAQ